MKNFKFKNLLTLPALLNIGGIGIAIAAFYIMITLVVYHLTFNHGFNDYENIYMITHDKDEPAAFMCRPIGETVLSQLPVVEKFGCMRCYSSASNFYKKDGEDYSKIYIRTTECSQGIFETFNINILHGDINNFKDSSDMAISRKVAESFNLNVGDIVSINKDGSVQVEIVAVYEDFPLNTELSNNNGFICIGKGDLDNWSNFNEIYYLRVKDGTQNAVEQIEKGARPILRDLNNNEEQDIESEIDNFAFSATPLQDIHLGKTIDGLGNGIGQFDKTIVYTLLILAIVVVLIAYINYFNFFLARVPERLKSVNTRKILGCSRAKLVWSLVAESLMHTAAAVVVAYIVINVMFVCVLNDSLAGALFVYADNLRNVFLTLGIATVAAVTASIYPALFITSVPPALAIKGSYTQNPKNKLRYALIGFQITASIALIIGTLFIRLNNDYMLNSNLGFNTESILSTYTSTSLASKSETVRSKLLQNPDILDIAWGNGDMVATERMGWGRNIQRTQEYINVQCYPVSWNFLKFLGINIVEGRDFTPADEQSESGVYIFNEAAKKEYNLQLSDKVAGHSDYTEIAGFCADFKFKPLKFGIEPFAFYVFGKDAWWYPTHLYIKLAPNADMVKTGKFIGETLNEIDPNYDFLAQNVISFNYEIARNYSQEIAMAKLITIFTIAIIIIAVMGVFGIVLFETQRRRKEIGIRKVNGATIGEILGLFNKKFLILVGVCFAIAGPIAYFAVNKFLSSYTYHCPIYWWVFVIALVTTLTITLLVVTAASIRAANENPVNTLKTE